MKAKGFFFFRFAIELLILLSALLGFSALSRQRNPPTLERIVYEQFSNSTTSDLWLVDLAEPDAPQQLTSNAQGKTIYRYQASADGQTIVYSVYNRNSPIYDNLMRLTIATGEQIPVTNCAFANTWCQNFALSASGDYLMYHYLSYPYFHEMRVVDLRSNPFIERTVYRFDTTQPSYPQPTTVGKSNTFSFEVSSAGFDHQLYDADSNMLSDMLPLGTPNRIPIFSDDGSRYAYIQSERDIEPSIIEVRQANYPYPVTSKYRDWDFSLTATGWIGGFVHDWYPDNEHLLMGVGTWRQCSASAQNSHYISQQLQLFNTSTGQMTELPLVGTNSWATWNESATKIMLSAPIDACVADSDYELTIYDMATSVKTTLPINAHQPQWLGQQK